MTINRILLSTVPLLLMIGVLALGNPQWKWCYVFQAYYAPWINRFDLKDLGPADFPEAIVVDKNQVNLVPPINFWGTWKIWSRSGLLLQDTEIRNGTTILINKYGNNGKIIETWEAMGKFYYVTKEGDLFSIYSHDDVCVFSKESKIDRRTEFGIEVE